MYSEIFQLFFINNIVILTYSYHHQHQIAIVNVWQAAIGMSPFIVINLFMQGNLAHVDSNLFSI